MWSNLFIFSGICLLSSNFLPFSETMDFQSNFVLLGQKTPTQNKRTVGAKTAARLLYTYQGNANDTRDLEGLRSGEKIKKHKYPPRLKNETENLYSIRLRRRIRPKYESINTSGKKFPNAIRSWKESASKSSTAELNRWMLRFGNTKSHREPSVVCGNGTCARTLEDANSKDKIRGENCTFVHFASDDEKLFWRETGGRRCDKAFNDTNEVTNLVTSNDPNGSKMENGDEYYVRHAEVVQCAMSSGAKCANDKRQNRTNAEFSFNQLKPDINNVSSISSQSFRNESERKNAVFRRINGANLSNVKLRRTNKTFSKVRKKSRDQKVHIFRRKINTHNRSSRRRKRQAENGEKTDSKAITSTDNLEFFLLESSTRLIGTKKDNTIYIDTGNNKSISNSATILNDVRNLKNDISDNGTNASTTETNISTTDAVNNSKSNDSMKFFMASIKDTQPESINAKKTQKTDDQTRSEKLRRLASTCASSGTNDTVKNVIFILGLFALTNGPSERVVGQSEITAASLAIEHINQMQILGCEYELQMLVNNTQEDPGRALNNFFYAMYKDQKKRIKALLGSSNAEVTHALAKVTLAWDIPTISFGLSSPQLSDNHKYPMFFRTVAPDSSHNLARIAFLHFFKWNAITTICQQEDQYSWGINDLSTKLEQSNITQEKTISFSAQDFASHLKLMPNQDSKIIVASFSDDVAPRFFCMVYDMGLYGGDYVWILPGTLRNRWWNTDKHCTKQKLTKAINGLILIGSKKQLDDDEFAISFMNEKEFENSLPKLKSEFVRETYDAVWATALSLNRTLSSCKNENIDCLNKSFHKSFQKQFVNNFQFVQFKGTSGPILFHGADRICVTNFYQIQDGEIFQIAQYDPLTLQLNFNCSNCKDIIWPSGYIPVSKRTYEVHIMNITPVAFYVINSFAILGILVSLCFLVFNIYYREQKYIKLSSPYLNATTIMGCILVYLAVIFLGIDKNTMPPAFTFHTICTARVALLSTGCSLAFGSIFAKTYRVHQIFIKSNHGILKSKVLQDSRLVPIIGVFVLIDGVIIVIWTAIDPLEHDLYNLTLEASVSHPEIIHQLQVEVCNSEYKNTWLFALGIYKAVFFILGLYMAWETRNVKIPSLNDSEYIGLTVYTVLITTILHFTLANVTSDRITLAYITSTSLILFTTTSSMCLLFLPKVKAIFNKKDAAHRKIVSSKDLKIESNTIRFVKNDDQEPYYRVHIQNFAYRKYVAFLDREIQNLHYKVYIKKDDEPDLLARRATKIYDKLPNLRKYRREKSSSLCGGIPNLFMLTVFPVVIPRASWPYAEHLDRPITEEMSFSSETKLQSIKFEDSNSPKQRDSDVEELQKYENSIPSSPLKRIFDNDEYQDTSSDVDEDHNQQSNSVLKICKAIVHSPFSEDELTKLDGKPKILITDTDELNQDNNKDMVNNTHTALEI